MTKSTRRTFLKTTAAAGAGYFVAAGVSPKRSVAAIEEIQFCCIGVGGKGSSDSRDAFRSGKVVAICDVDGGTLNKAAGDFKGAKSFTDWRKALDEFDKGTLKFDAVTVSTPDHSHAPASIWSMNRGLHCFCQKPLTHSIHEARRMGEVAKEKKVATEMGNQGTANSDLRHVAAICQSGKVGKIKECHVWTNRPIWPQGLDRPKDEPKVPENLNWEVWLGPAPERPYHPAYHPFKWRGWWDFGTGALGDMACHTLNMPFAALGLRDPISVQAETSGHNRETYPAWSIITFEFPANDKRGPVTLKWYDGGKRPDAELVKGAKNEFKSSGAIIVADEATLYAPDDYASNAEWIGKDKLPEAEYERSPGHFEEWIRAIKEGKPAMSNFPDYAGPLTETILLGNLAVFAAAEPGTGKKIEWNSKSLEATNAPEVMHIVKKQYRAGFALEG